MSFIEKADLAALNGLQIVDALADNDTLLLAAMFENHFTNPQFQEVRRGTSFAPTSSLIMADRWKGRRETNQAGSTYSRQTGFSGKRHCWRVQRNNGDSSTKKLYFTQQFDSEEIEDLAGKDFYVAFDVRAGANFSAASGNLTCRVNTGTGFNETVSEESGFATGNAAVSLTQAISTTAERKFFGPFAIPAGTTEIAVTLEYTPVGTAGAADYFDVTGFRGNNAANLGYQRRHYAFEEFLCERHTELLPGIGVSGGYIGNGYKASTTFDFIPWKFRTRKASTPTLLTSTPTWATAIPTSANSVAAQNRTASGFQTITGALTVNLSANQDLALLSFQAATSFNGTNMDVLECYCGSAVIIGAQTGF